MQRSKKVQRIFQNKKGTKYILATIGVAFNCVNQKAVDNDSICNCADNRRLSSKQPDNPFVDKMTRTADS